MISPILSAFWRAIAFLRVPIDPHCCVLVKSADNSRVPIEDLFYLPGHNELALHISVINLLWPIVPLIACINLVANLVNRINLVNSLVLISRFPFPF